MRQSVAILDQVRFYFVRCLTFCCFASMAAMKKAMKAAMKAKAMKAMKAKAMKASKGGHSLTKGGLADACATATELKKSDCSKVLSALAEVVQASLKKTGRVIVQGIARVVAPATSPRRKQASARCLARP